MTKDNILFHNAAWKRGGRKIFAKESVTAGHEYSAKHTGSQSSGCFDDLKQIIGQPSDITLLGV